MESKKNKVSFQPNKSKENEAFDAPPGFHRRGEKHKTITHGSLKGKEMKEQLKNLQKIKESSKKRELDTIQEVDPNNYQRRKGHSKSLIEKSKLGSQIFKAELRLKVQINNVIEEAYGLPTNKYKVISIIGEGSFGTVYLASNLVTKAKVAIKKINKNKENEVDDLEIKNEIDILKNLDHPNIVKILEFYTTQKAYYVVQSYCQCGELYDQLKFQFNENQLAVLFYQIFSGLAYLHSQKILHRDLKLENIMIQEMEKDESTGLVYMWAKIIDFGAAKVFEKYKTQKAIVGSSYYIAPEVLKQNYNEKCDIWSIGVILYMLIVGRAPFDGSDDDEILESIKRGRYNENHKKLLAASKEVRDLIKKLLNIDPKERLSAYDALKHDWFKVFKGKSLYTNISKEKIEVYINRLVDFPTHIHSKLQQMVLAFIIHNIPDSPETKDILKIFRQFNTNDDGKLTKDELKKGLMLYLPKERVKKEIDDIFLILNGANREFIEFEEFLRACLDQKYVCNEEHLAYAYNFLSKGGDKISIAKIKNIFVGNDCSEAVFESIFREIDTDNNGEIDFMEFKEMMED